MKIRLTSFVIAFLLCSIGGSNGFAQTEETGATFTPDRRTFLISKDLPGENGPERFTIAANLATPGDLESVTSFTGNVFQPGGGAPSFIDCNVRPDSKGSLSDPDSTIRLSCLGSDACPVAARTCARESWSPIPSSPSLIELPASFFLPVPRDTDTTSAASAAVPTGTGRVSGGGEVGRGATLSADGRIHLVSKDQAGNRWAVEVVLREPERDDVGTDVQSVTGNVFPSAGGPPIFLFCTPRAENTGTLQDPGSDFTFSCQADDPCTDGVACADGWEQLDDGAIAPVPASFFLPPGGLPARPQSDDGIYTIGLRGDPPSYAVSGVSGGSSFLPADKRAMSVLGAACGGRCTIDRLGTCANLLGTMTLQANGVCACQLDRVDPGCVGCGDLSEDGTCGGDCEFAVGSSGQTARGTCVPVSADDSTCTCVATGFDGSAAIRTCSADSLTDCSMDECCIDDPRDGCEPGEASATCPGICAPAEGSNSDLCLASSDFGLGIDPTDPRCSAPTCQFLFCGTELDGQCPLDFQGAGDGCDCGCGFEDPDCDFDPMLPDQTDPRCSDASCDFIYCGTELDNACSTEFQGAGDGCDCGCQFDDPDCDLPPAPDFDDPRCAQAQCDFAHCGTDTDNACPQAFNGTGDGCDCGCQFDDPDCGGLEPNPDDPRCALAVCEVIHCGTALDNNCPLSFSDNDDGCDCGCQFLDPDCNGVQPTPQPTAQPTPQPTPQPTASPTPGPFCGDAVVTPPEECDGQNLNAFTCTDLDFGPGGFLDCDTECQFDTADCIEDTAPTVTAVTPNPLFVVVDGSGTLTVSFSDPNGDVVQACTSTEPNFSGGCISFSASGLTTGSVGGQINCGPAPGMITFDSYVIDSSGNESNHVEVTLNCQDFS